MTNLIWKRLVKRLGMMVRKQNPSLSLCVCRIAEHTSWRRITQDTSPLLNTPICARHVCHLDGLDYECRRCDGEFPESMNEWHRFID